MARRELRLAPALVDLAHGECGHMPDGKRLAAAGIDAAADDHRRVVGQVEDVRVAQVRDLRNEYADGIHIADLDVPPIQLGDALQIRRVAVVDDALPVKDGALYRR